MNFLNIRIPENISFVSEGGPNFLTNIVCSEAGKEFRNSKSMKPFSKYYINYSKLSQQMMQNLLSFFYIVKGRAHSFRFKDFLDFKSEILGQKSNQIKNLKNFTILSNDVFFQEETWGICLQLYKNYFFPRTEFSQTFNSLDSENNPKYEVFTRKITKPTNSSIKFWEVLLDGSWGESFFDVKNFKLDETSGLLYLKNKIDLTNIDISFEFDVCVRFANDSLKISNLNPGIFKLEAIELLEVFE